MLFPWWSVLIFILVGFVLGWHLGAAIRERGQARERRELKNAASRF